MNFFFLFLFSISFNVEATPDCPPPQACENVGRVNLTGRGLEKIIDSSIRSSIEGIKKDLLDNPSIDKEGLSAKSAGLAGSLRNIKLQDVEIKYKGIKLVDPENLKYEVEFEFPEILLASQLSMKPILKEDYNDFLIKLREVNGKSPKIKFQLQLDPITGKIAELARVNSTKVSVPEGSITFPENKEVEKNLTSKQKNTLKSFRGLATDLSGYQEVVDGILGEMSGSFENLQNKVNLTLANLSEYTKSYEQVQLPDLNVADLKTKGTELTDGHRSTKSLISEVRVDIKTAQEKNQQNWEKHLQKVMSSIDKALTGNVQQAITVSAVLRTNPASVKAVKDPGLEQFLQGFNLTKSDVGSDLVADLYEDVLKLQQEYSSYLRSLEKQGVPVYSNPRVTEIDIKFDEALEKLKKQYEALQQRADDQDQQQTVQSLFNKIDGVNKGVVAIPMYTPELPCPPNGRFVLANEKIRGDYDFSTVVGVDYLNHYLETSGKRGNFAFCAEFARVDVNG